MTDLIGGDAEWVARVEGVGRVGRQRRGGGGGLRFGRFGAEDTPE